MDTIDIKKVNKNFNGVLMIAGDNLTSKILTSGYCDFEQNVLHTVNSEFLICSISKMFVAVAINQLCEKGILRKEDLLNEYLPYYFKKHKITLYQLLTHTSGLPNYVMYKKELDWEVNHTADEILGLMDSKPLKFKPGTKWCYCNTGYYLLALIIEKVTGLKHEDYIQKNIFDVAQMKRSSFVTSPQAKAVPPHIKGKRCKTIHSSLLLGAGDIVSTVKDLYLFGKALVGGGLISDETLKTMYIPVFPDKKLKYGEGMFTNEHHGTLQIGHSGSIPGYVTHMSIYPNEKIVSIVLLNNRTLMHPLVYPDINAKYLEGCLAEQLFHNKVSVVKKAYL